MEGRSSDIPKHLLYLEGLEEGDLFSDSEDEEIGGKEKTEKASPSTAEDGGGAKRAEDPPKDKPSPGLRGRKTMYCMQLAVRVASELVTYPLLTLVNRAIFLNVGKVEDFWRFHRKIHFFYGIRPLFDGMLLHLFNHVGDDITNELLAMFTRGWGKDVGRVLRWPCEHHDQRMILVRIFFFAIRMIWKRGLCCG